MVEEGANTELVELLAQESGGQISADREPFEDQYGDMHDWTSGVTTQLYLCRQLYLHYTLQVSGQCGQCGCLPDTLPAGGGCAHR